MRTLEVRMPKFRAQLALASIRLRDCRFEN